MNNPIIGLGAGGHAKVIIEILKLNKSYKLWGLLDPMVGLHGKKVLGIPVLGSDDLLPKLKNEGVNLFFVGLGGIGDNKPRRQLFEIGLKHGLKPADIIHPQAIISPSVIINRGCVIMAGAVVNSCAKIGNNTIVNTNSVVEHDCIIGDDVHIASGAVLASTVHVDDLAHVGAGAAILQRVSIGKGAIIGAGAVVVKDVPPCTTVVGIPAQPLTESGEK